MSADTTFDHARRGAPRWRVAILFLTSVSLSGCQMESPEPTPQADLGAETLAALGRGIAGAPEAGQTAAGAPPKPQASFLAAEYKQHVNRQMGKTAPLRAQIAQQQAEINSLKLKLRADAAQYEAEIASLRAKIVLQRRPSSTAAEAE